MRYLCLVCLPVGESSAAIEAARRAMLEELDRGGHLLAAGALEPGDSAVLVRVRAGQVSITLDGPAGTLDEPAARGPIDAFFVLEARDLNEAIQLAARDPGARQGHVAVRALRYFG